MMLTHASFTQTVMFERDETTDAESVLNKQNMCCTHVVNLPGLLNESSEPNSSVYTIQLTGKVQSIESKSAAITRRTWYVT